MYGDLMSYLQLMGICERWVMEWYLLNREEMMRRDPALYKFAHHIYKRYF